MSFSVQFTAANKADAEAILAKEFLPDTVRSILASGLEAVKYGQAVSIKAIGHIYNNDYAVTTADVSVTPITFRVPPVVAVEVEAA